MTINKLSAFIYILITIGAMSFCSNEVSKSPEEEYNILSHEVNPNKEELKFYWKDGKDEIYGSIENLKSSLAERKAELVFATNGGMYTKSQKPQGLYIENGLTLSPIDKTEIGYGNFYLQPNGIFYIKRDNKPVICGTDSFEERENIMYATQSGPMLIIDSIMHPKFNKGSSNLNIRNGVGILPNGNLIFGMSKSKINFYDFASYFKIKGCNNALYLDGFVSRTYLPSKNCTQLDGQFGVIIGQTKRN